MEMGEKVQNLAENEDIAACCSPNKSSSMGKLVDPLTGKRIELIWQNGFSSFEDKGNGGACKTEEHTDWRLHPRSSGKIFCDQGIGNAMGITYASDRKKRILQTVNFNGEAKQTGVGVALRELYKTWKNPVFGVSKEKQLETQVEISVKRKQKKLKLGTTSFTFCKESFRNIHVIGQVDNKFIACTFSTENEGDKNSRILLLVDQHAAHERIRLEALQDQFLQGLHKNSKGFSVDCKRLSPPLSVALFVPLDCSMKKLKYSFEKIGIHYTVKSEKVVEEKNSVELYLLAMPTMFIDSSKIYGNKPVLELSAIKELFYDHIKQDQAMPFASPLISPSINNVLCSYACHSAIRFGDALTIIECSAIIKSLAKCRLPFQCAHGRPSIAPLVNLDISS